MRRKNGPLELDKNFGASGTRVSFLGRCNSLHFITPHHTRLSHTAIQSTPRMQGSTLSKLWIRGVVSQAVGLRYTSTMLEPWLSELSELSELSDTLSGHYRTTIGLDYRTRLSELSDVVVHYRSGHTFQHYVGHYRNCGALSDTIEH